MMREYVERLYLPVAVAFRRRSARGAQLAQELQVWQARAASHWSDIQVWELGTLAWSCWPRVLAAVLGVGVWRWNRRVGKERLEAERTEGHSPGP